MAGNVFAEEDWWRELRLDIAGTRLTRKKDKYRHDVSLDASDTTISHRAYIDAIAFSEPINIINAICANIFAHYGDLTAAKTITRV